ncbi:MAG TPA: response regulator transcription factor [Gemmatimonadaceae bacterium]
MTDALTLIIADDHPLFRKGVADVLRSDSAIHLLGEASDGETALRMIRQLTPRIAVLDLDMPGRNGLQVIEAVREEQLPVTIVMLTMYAGTDMLQRALALGVRGYVSKESAADDILACVHLVASGRTYVSANLASPASTVRAALASAATGLGELTPAERTVLKLIAASKTSREIAETLKLSPKTVENHRSNICQKLGVTGNNALVRFAMEHSAELKAL